MKPQSTEKCWVHWKSQYREGREPFLLNFRCANRWCVSMGHFLNGLRVVTKGLK